MTEAKKPYIGEDGGLYFNYAVGAEYVFRAAGVEFSQRIIACEYENGKEYYRLESAGKLLPTRFSVPELEILLARLPYVQTAEGEREKLPLLKEEVKEYFAQMYKERNFANAKENEKLKGTEHGKLNNAYGTLKKKLMLAQADDRTADIAEIKKQMQENEAAREKIIKDKNVDKALLIKKIICEKCNDTGLIGEEICACAIARTEQIKAYNAALRRAARKGGAND